MVFSNLINSSDVLPGRSCANWFDHIFDIRYSKLGIGLIPSQIQDCGYDGTEAAFAMQ